MKRVTRRSKMTRISPRRSSPEIPQRPNILRGERVLSAPSQSRSRIRRERLMRAALELFAREGFEAASIGEIAKRAGSATGGFYQYFSSKRQLLLVLMSDLLEKLERIDMRPETSDLRDAIETVLRTGLTTDLAYAGAYRAWREAAMSDKAIAGLDVKVRSWTTFRLRSVFGAIQQLPNARGELDVELFASLMDRLFWDLLGTSLTADSRLIETLAHVVYHALIADGRAKNAGVTTRRRVSSRPLII